ncbi:MAG: hydrolase [bacterium]
MRHPQILKRDEALILVVDIQERLAAAMERKDDVIENVRKLIFSSKRLGLPIVVTEQYPKGLGPTVGPIKEALGEFFPVEKLDFSCCGVGGVREALRKLGRSQIVIVGMETHVCILQTALDLLGMGYRAYVPADAVCSRKEGDWRTALERMREAGVVVTTTEMAIFELLERAGTLEFKEISKILK